MVMKKLFLLLTLFLALQTSTFAQKSFSEGWIKYKVESFDAEDIPAMAATMLKNGKIIMKLGKEYTKVEMDMGMVKTSTINYSEDRVVMLMSMLGQKMAVTMNPLEMQEEGVEEEDVIVPEYSETGKTMEILGYECKEVVAQMGDGIKTTLWVTSKIKPKNSNTQFTQGNINGFPLRFEAEQSGMKMIYIATKLEAEPIDSDEFEIPEDYEKMTMKEFQEKMGNMGGGF